MSRTRSFSVQLPPDLIVRTRRTVAGLQQRQGFRVVLWRFVADALEAHIERTEREFNEGRPFDAPPDLPVGRRFNVEGDEG